MPYGSALPKARSESLAGGEPDRKRATDAAEHPRATAILAERLKDLAQMALRTTHSDGIAIVLERNAEFVCSARAGETSPSVGAVVDRDSGLSGQCIRTGTTLVCGDAESDTRVDPAACRLLGIQSVAAVPLRCASRTIGVIEAFSAEREAFGDDAVRVLERLADVVVAAVAHEYEPAPTPVPIAEDDAGDVGDLSAAREGTVTACPTVSVTGGLDSFFAMPPELAFRRRVSAWASAHKVLLIILLTSAVLLLAGVVRTVHARARQRAAVVAPKPDPLRTAAEKGDAAAQYRLALDIAQGRRLARDATESVQWLQKSANLGNADAQYELGKVLAQGRGGPPDLVSAYTWYLVAALSGKTDADAAARALAPSLTRVDIAQVRFHLGQMYASGIAVRQDYANAYSWLTLAEAAGNREATVEKANVAAHMSRQQIAEGTRRAAQWLVRHQGTVRHAGNGPVTSK